MRCLPIVLLFASCGSAPPAPPAMPDSAGRGIVQCDQEPPAGAATWQRPAWHAGDKFTLVRGAILRGDFVVREATGTHYTIATGGPAPASAVTSLAKSTFLIHGLSMCPTACALPSTITPS